MTMIQETAPQLQRPTRIREDICSRCILKVGDVEELTFDEQGVCNYCRAVDRQLSALPASLADRERAAEHLVARIKEAGTGKAYDCIMGLSGGVDSTYLAYQARQWGLRPLAVHFDNGWNSELAVANIENIVTRLGLDLHTLVVNWDEFRDLQLAYFKASVIDVEIPTDHAIYGTLHRLAVKHGIKFILSGNNIATEGILPASWSYPHKGDYINLMAIHRRYGTKQLKTYPLFDRQLKSRARRAGIEVVTPLDLMDYNLHSAKDLIKSELGWRDYGGKHHESIFTRFYQTNFLPRKFGVNKRIAHIASLVSTGQLSREEALLKLQQPTVPAEVLESDKQFVLKKLGLSESEFDEILALPVRKHRDFPTEGSFFEYFPMFKPLRPVWRFAKNRLAKHAA